MQVDCESDVCRAHLQESTERRGRIKQSHKAQVIKPPSSPGTHAHEGRGCEQDGGCGGVGRGVRGRERERRAHTQVNTDLILEVWVEWRGESSRGQQGEMTEQHHTRLQLIGMVTRHLTTTSRTRNVSGYARTHDKTQHPPDLRSNTPSHHAHPYTPATRRSIV